jgi:uncharacterized protein YjbJ (UPF0337 family)
MRNAGRRVKGASTTNTFDHPLRREPCCSSGEEDPMNKDQVKGKVENLKGRAKQAAGTATGNHRTEAEGAVERAKGAAREKLGDAKQSLGRGGKTSEEEETPARRDH